MRRERARRWMVPAAAQRVRDRAAKSIGTVILLHRDDSVVGKGFARHGDKPNPAAAQSALHRRQYVEQEVGAGGARVEHVAEDTGEVEIAAKTGRGGAVGADDQGEVEGAERSSSISPGYGLVESAAGVGDGGDVAA